MGNRAEVPGMGDGQGLLCQAEGFTHLPCFYRPSSTPRAQCCHT